MISRQQNFTFVRVELALEDPGARHVKTRTFGNGLSPPSEMCLGRFSYRGSGIGSPLHSPSFLFFSLEKGRSQNFVSNSATKSSTLGRNGTAFFRTPVRRVPHSYFFFFSRSRQPLPVIKPRLNKSARILSSLLF